MKHPKTTRSVMLALLLALFTAVAAAQSYPTKPVRLIIAFQLAERLGRQVVADNQGGAGGIIGTETAAKSAPDGHTLLLISSAYAFGASMYKLPYDPATAFAPVALLGTGPVVLAVNSKLPVNSLKELIALD